MYGPALEGKSTSRPQHTGLRSASRLQLIPSLERANASVVVVAFALLANVIMTRARIWAGSVMLFYLRLFVWITICACAGQAVACAVRSTPDNSGRSQWYCANASSTVVVFVHGLNASNEATWLHASGSGKKARAYWPDLVLGDPLVAASSNTAKPPSVLLASFHTGPGSQNFSIADAQQQLSEALFASVDGQRPAIEKQVIIFVGHSLGGVLTRDLLSRHAQRFLGKRIGLLLAASPSKGSSFANIARAAQWALGNQMVRELEEGSAYLDDVHNRFSQSIAAGGALRFLVGRELYEHLSMLESGARCASNTLSLVTVVCAVGQRIASYVGGGPIVPRKSAVVYWPETAKLVPQSDHLTIAQPSDPGHPSHLALRQLIHVTNQAATAPCVPPRNLRLTFNIQEDAQVSVGRNLDQQAASFDLFQLNTDDGSLVRPALPLSFDTLSQLYRLRLAEPPFPCENERFWGKLIRRIQTSQQTDLKRSATDICFRRARRKPTPAVVVFKCIEGENCAIPRHKRGLADVCRAQDRDGVMLAMAPGERSVVHWNGPSLTTLERTPAQVRPGYTEFHVVSDVLTYMSSATSFGYGVYVNGVPVHIDGNPPFFAKQPISKGARVHLTFPIENLGFRGGNKGDGYEDVELQIRFYEDKDPIGTAKLQRRYVAYRHAPVETGTDPETGEKFSWRAIYRPAESGQNFEVMLEHGPSPEWMKERRAAFDQLRKTYRGQETVGVLRPGRRENRRVGMIVGLAKENGQVQSLFSRKRANELCRWVIRQSEFSELQQIGAYIFEFPKETFDDKRDRGRRVAYCQDV